MGKTKPLRHSQGLSVHLVEVRPQYKLWYPAAERPHPFNLPLSRWYRGGVVTKRDSMRQKCYDAERRMYAKVDQQKFENITEAARYLRALMETKWFQRRWPLFKTCVVTYAPTMSGASAVVLRQSSEMPLKASIKMSEWALNDPKEGGALILLHELAHGVCPEGHGHGRLWARTFVELVRFRMGREIGDLLGSEFRNAGVIPAPVRRVSMSEEQKKRLAACRPPSR